MTKWENREFHSPCQLSSWSIFCQQVMGACLSAFCLCQELWLFFNILPKQFSWIIRTRHTSTRRPHSKQWARESRPAVAACVNKDLPAVKFQNLVSYGETFQNTGFHPVSLSLQQLWQLRFCSHTLLHFSLGEPWIFSCFAVFFWNPCFFGMPRRITRTPGEAARPSQEETFGEKGLLPFSSYSSKERHKVPHYPETF